MTVDLSRPSVPLPVVEADAAFLAAAARTNSPSDRLAFLLDAQLVHHPEVCATEADYPEWAAQFAAARKAEAVGGKTWRLTPQNIAWIDDLVDHDGHYAKGYFEAVDGKTTCVGLRIGTGETRIVAHYGDYLIRHPNGTWTVHKAPEPVR